MSKTIALIIGVSNYNIPKVNQLPFCKNDIVAKKTDDSVFFAIRTPDFFKVKP